MKNFDYSIRIEKLQPPIGGILKYASKVSYIYETNEGQPDKEVKHNSEECWGKTEDEAREKMKEKIEAWKKVK